MKRLHASVFTKTLMCLPTLAFAGIGNAEEYHQFEADLSGAQEVVFDDSDAFVPGGTDTDATGRVDILFSDSYTEAQLELSFGNLAGIFSAAHFHCGRPGENGPVVFGLVNPGPLALEGQTIRGTITNDAYTGEDCSEIVDRPINNLVSLARAMRDGLVYANVHSDSFPAGEIRGQMLADDDDDDIFDDDDDL